MTQYTPSPEERLNDRIIVRALQTKYETLLTAVKAFAVTNKISDPEKAVDAFVANIASDVSNICQKKTKSVAKKVVAKKKA